MFENFLILIGMIPTGYTQSSGQWPLQPNPAPLQLSMIGDPIPGAAYARRQGIARAMFPDKFPRYPGSVGPLRAGA